MIYSAGGIPVLLPNIEKPDEKLFCEIAHNIDGLLMSGGGDISPEYYGKELSSYEKGVSPRRDFFEFHFGKYFIENTEKPVLGVCRGHQVLNVILGGDLYQDVEEMWRSKKQVIKIEHRRHGEKEKRSWHKVRILKPSKLFDILGCQIIVVNSSHHQIVNNISNRLIISAIGPDEANEALEFNGERFILSIQWHPESIDNDYSKKIFSAFVEASIIK